MFQAGQRVWHKHADRFGRVDLADNQTQPSHYVTIIWEDGEGHGLCAEADLLPAGEEDDPSDTTCR
ncbi:MAG: hypothetical protein WD534_14875 [Phycisphaeraceae bacterium]